MRSRAPVRGWWALPVVAGLTLIVPAPAQPPGAAARPARGPADAEAQRQAEINVELAWLADPLTFPYPLTARTHNGLLEIRGLVPNDAVHVRAVRAARLGCNLDVMDNLKVHPIPTRTVVVRPEELHSAVQNSLRASFPSQARGMNVLCRPQGQVILSGRVASLEDKLAISQALRRVPGCHSVVNQLFVGGVSTVQPGPAARPAQAAAPTRTTPAGNFTPSPQPPALPPSSTAATYPSRLPVAPTDPGRTPLRVAQGPMPSGPQNASPYGQAAAPAKTPIPPIRTSPPPATGPTPSAQPASPYASSSAPVPVRPQPFTTTQAVPAPTKVAPPKPQTSTVVRPNPAPAPIIPSRPQPAAAAAPAVPTAAQPAPIRQQTFATERPLVTPGQVAPSGTQAPAAVRPEPAQSPSKATAPQTSVATPPRPAPSTAQTFPGTRPAPAQITPAKVPASRMALPAPATVAPIMAQRTGTASSYSTPAPPPNATSERFVQETRPIQETRPTSVPVRTVPSSVLLPPPSTQEAWVRPVPTTAPEWPQAAASPVRTNTVVPSAPQQQTVQTAYRPDGVKQPITPTGAYNAAPAAPAPAAAVPARPVQVAAAVPAPRPMMLPARVPPRSVATPLWQPQPPPGEPYVTTGLLILPDLQTGSSRNDTPWAQRQDFLRRAIQATCGPSVTDLAVEIQSPTEALIRFRVPSKAEADRLWPEIQRIPELTPYKLRAVIKAPER